VKQDREWEKGVRTEKLKTISNNRVVLKCYARDSLSFVHLCDIWSYTQEIRVKIRVKGARSYTQEK